MNLNWIVENADKLGVVAILLIVVVGLIWAVRFLYNAEKKCEEARRADRDQTRREHGEIREEVGTLKGKVETLQVLHTQHLASLIGNRNE